jgi:hypothetical protein
LAETFTMKPTKRQVLRALHAFDLGIGAISEISALAMPRQPSSGLPVDKPDVGAERWNFKSG